MSELIRIPAGLVADRATRLLITQWRNHLLRYRVCNRRVNWKNTRAQAIEKRRRREKWIIVARVLEIEFTLLQWCAKHTKHHDLWTSKDPDAPESRWHDLRRKYRLNRRSMRYLTSAKRERALARRQQLVTQIRALEREWMVALFTHVYPHDRVPPPLTLHPSELRPRKIKSAILTLQSEVA